MGNRERLLDKARNELFSHINHCEVVQAAPDDQEEWMADTIEYLAERYPQLKEGELADLRSAGLQFCKPPIPHGPGNPA